MLVKIAVFISLMAASAFLVLKFFGKLVNVDMFSAVLQARPLFNIAIIICYILSFMLLYVFFFLFPLRVFDMNKYHAGGLTGYVDEWAWDSRVYDPSKGTYVKYLNSNAQLPAEKFTETFEVVSFYRQPPSEYYEDTDSLGLVNNLIAAILGPLFCVGVYFLLYNIAKEYIETYSMKIKLSHDLIASRFSDITRISPLTALIIFLIVTALIFGWTVISAKLVRNHYRKMYEPHQQTLRNEILRKVTPGNTVTGSVNRRFYIQMSDSTTTEGLRGTRTKTRYYSAPVYIVEFRDLIQIPVYLKLRYMENEDREELDRHFPDGKAVIPKLVKDYAFIVNQDYSISLKKDTRGDRAREKKESLRIEEEE